MRALLFAAGVLSVVVGAIGLFVPVLPTTPFMLLAAACFVRASPRAHRWLLGTRTFGPMIREWENHRSIRWRTKIFAISLMSLTIAASIVFFVRPWPLQLAVGLLGVAVGTWLYRVPSRDRPRRS
jgi:uncharacterized membrane protein YbaN (DUF454 family)